MCTAKSFFSRTMEAQFATGATHDMRIFTGSELLAGLRSERPNAQAAASASFRKRMISSHFAGLAFVAWQTSRRERRRLSEVQRILASLSSVAKCPPSGTRGVTQCGPGPNRQQARMQQKALRLRP